PEGSGGRVRQACPRIDRAIPECGGRRGGRLRSSLRELAPPGFLRWIRRAEPMSREHREIGHIGLTREHKDEGRDMNRILTLTYGAVSYVIFFLTFLYAIGFLGNVGVPKSLDSGATDPWLRALTIDLGLLSLFALQHSVMARPGFKRLLI